MSSTPQCQSNYKGLQLINRIYFLTSVVKIGTEILERETSVKFSYFCTIVNVHCQKWQ